MAQVGDELRKSNERIIREISRHKAAVLAGETTLDPMGGIGTLCSACLGCCFFVFWGWCGLYQSRVREDLVCAKRSWGDLTRPLALGANSHLGARPTAGFQLW